MRSVAILDPGVFCKQRFYGLPLPFILVFQRSANVGNCYFTSMSYDDCSFQAQ